MQHGLYAQGARLVSGQATASVQKQGKRERGGEKAYA